MVWCGPFSAEFVHQPSQTINVEARFFRNALKIVGKKKPEAALETEKGIEVG